MINPYSEVNWETYQHITSVSHAHITEQAHFENAYAEGVKHFAISNYYPSVPVYPLSELFTSIPADAISCPNAEHFDYTNTGAHCNSIGSIFASGDGDSGTDTTWQAAFDAMITNLQFPNGGGIIINHPALADPTNNWQEILSMLDYAPQVLGIEVYNDTSEITVGHGWAVSRWDAILATGRRCYGFFVPDHQAKSGAWLGRNVLLVPNSTEENCLLAYRNGSFYGAMQGSGLAFTDITATETQISVSTNSANKIKFISNKGTSEIGGNTGVYAVNDDVYVRIVAEDSAGEQIFSQPIIYGANDKYKNRKRKIIVTGYH